MIRKLVAFFSLIRTGNLLLMMATLSLSYYCLTDYLTLDDLLAPRFLMLGFCVMLTAAAGYIINDYHDINIDLTNKPEKVIIGKDLSRRWAMLLHFSFNSLAFLLGFYLHPFLGLSILMCTIALWLYSVHFKKQFLSGNLLVAALSAFVIIILPLFNPKISNYLVWAYALFAFGVSLIREIVKDAEDLRGDAKFNCKTLPIVLGVRKTKSILISISLVYIVLIFAHLFIANSLIPFRHHYGTILYLIYMLLLVIVPFVFSFYFLFRADVKADFTRLSSFYKIMMLCGLLSMLIIKL